LTTEQNVTLQPIEPAAYEAWLDNLIRSYAEDNAAAGIWPANEALDLARKQVGGMLAQGAATPGQHVYSIVAEGEPEPVGVLWFLERKKLNQAFICDLEIHAAYRRRGYAERAMRAAEAAARGLGLDTMGLHVFGHNHAARALYEKLGYEVTDLQMAKKMRTEQD